MGKVDIFDSILYYRVCSPPLPILILPIPTPSFETCEANLCLSSAAQHSEETNRTICLLPHTRLASITVSNRRKAVPLPPREQSQLDTLWHHQDANAPSPDHRVNVLLLCHSWFHFCIFLKWRVPIIRKTAIFRFHKSSRPYLLLKTSHSILSTTQNYESTVFLNVFIYKSYVNLMTGTFLVNTIHTLLGSNIRLVSQSCLYCTSADFLKMKEGRQRYGLGFFTLLTILGIAKLLKIEIFSNFIFLAW